MADWYGPISIDKVENPGTGDQPGLSANDLLFVHYPDCQQLSIWLPVPGSAYDHLRLLDAENGSLLEEWPVSEKLSGAIKILWDTLSLPPGKYHAQLFKNGQCLHQVSFTKYKEGEPEKVPAPLIPETEPDPAPIVYRDGLGNIIPDEDLLLRKKILQEMEDRFTRKLSYTSSGRSGTVIYTEGVISLTFYYELGGGNCIAFIDIPPAGQWEKRTGLPLDRREDILLFVAQRSQADQAPNGRYQIGADAILLLRD